MKLDITKRLSLAEYGEPWKECYLEFSMPAFKDIKGISGKDKTEEEIVEDGIDRLKNLFVKGRAIAGGKEVDVTADDIKDLPMDLINKALSLISGDVDKNLEKASSQ